MKESNPLTLNERKLEGLYILFDNPGFLIRPQADLDLAYYWNFIAQIFQCKNFSNQKLNL